MPCLHVSDRHQPLPSITNVCKSLFLCSSQTNEPLPSTIKVCEASEQRAAQQRLRALQRLRQDFDEKNAALKKELRGACCGVVCSVEGGEGICIHVSHTPCVSPSYPTHSQILVPGLREQVTTLRGRCSSSAWNLDKKAAILAALLRFDGMWGRVRRVGRYMCGCEGGVC